MFITLAYPYEGHQPDETIEVDDNTGRLMVRDGVARLPEVDTFTDLTADELRTYAADHGIDLGGAKKKNDLVAAIRNAEAAAPGFTPVSTTPAIADTNPKERH